MTIYAPGQKHTGPIPEIKYLPVNVIERAAMDFRPEVMVVSDEVARNMDFSEPVDATAFHYGKNNDPLEPSVLLRDGHHRTAAALQTGRPWLPISVRAINALGEKLNALIDLSSAIEAQILRSAPINSLGRPVHRTEAGIQKFNQWFQGSTTTDRAGRPRIFFHGTCEDFNSFAPENGVGEATWFSPDPAAADLYCHGHGARVIPVYLTVKNPLVAHASGPRKGPSYWAKEARRRGHDALILTSDDFPGAQPAYAIFSALQVKSIFNSGRWDGDSPSLTDSESPQENERHRAPRC